MNIVDRDGIKQGFYQTMAAEAEAMGILKPLSLEERQKSRADTLAARPKGADLWVFAYGSLMWNPAFSYCDQKVSRLYGYHRSFCLKTPIGRGSPENPGLVLGLDRGGSVQGLALKVEEALAVEELDVIWSREMLAGSYKPTWVKLVSQDKQTFHAIAFVMDRLSERYAGHLSPEETARLISRAEGSLGRCSDYLENTVAAIDKIGIADKALHQLQARVRTLQQSRRPES